MKKCKDKILECLVDNIKDQTPDDSLTFYMLAFDLGSDIDLKSRLENISKLNDIYSVNTDHKLKEKW